MATVQLSHHQLTGALGPILVDVRSAARDTSQPAVLFAHGFKGFKDYAFQPAMADRLARAGYTAITISVSGSGVNARTEFEFPDRFARNTYTRELADIETVIAAARAGNLDTAKPTTLGMIGYSRGGGVALCVANETPSVDALVTWAAMSTIRRYSDQFMRTWKRAGRIEMDDLASGLRLPMDYEIAEDALANESRFDIQRAAAELKIPWLLIHGTADETIPVEEGRLLASLASDPRFASRFIDGASHAFGARHPWAGHTAATEELFNATTKFFAHWLR